MSKVWWDGWLWELGFSICHQRLERMLFFGERPLFVCARDTGLLVSFFTLMLALSLLRGRDKAGMPPWPILAAAAAGILFLAWDGLTSYLGFRESTNTLRFLSGFAAGAGLAFPAAALVNGEVFGGDRSAKVGARPSDLVAAGSAGGAALILYLWHPGPLFRLGQLWLLASLLGTFWVLNLLLIYLVHAKEGGGLTLKRAALAVLLTAFELAGSYWLHRLFAGGGPSPVPGSRRAAPYWPRIAGESGLKMGMTDRCGIFTLSLGKSCGDRELSRLGGFECMQKKRR